MPAFRSDNKTPSTWMKFKYLPEEKQSKRTATAKSLVMLLDEVSHCILDVFTSLRPHPLQTEAKK